MPMYQSDRPAKATVPAVAGCVLAAILCRQITPSEPFLDAVSNILRPLFYAGLYFAWGISFRRRIIHKPTLYHLTGIAALMIFWIFIRSFKYMVPDEMAAALRLGWYMYYIPILLIPAMGLFLALYMRKPEGYVLPWQMYLLYVPSLIFIGLVLTNDMHQLVFRFPEGIPWTGKVYSYGMVYYILAAWDIICAAGFLIIILMKCRIQKSRKIIWIPLVVFGKPPSLRARTVLGCLCDVLQSRRHIFNGDGVIITRATPGIGGGLDVECARQSETVVNSNDRSVQPLIRTWLNNKLLIIRF